MAQVPKSIEIAARNRKARILIVDDQPIVRERLTELISLEPDMVPCGEADNCRNALQLAEKTAPDLIVTGLTLSDSHGLELIKDLHARYPRVRVLVFSLYEESIYAERAIRAGASGFITKHEPTKEVLRAVRRVLDGDIYLSERVTTDTVRRFFARSSLASESQLRQLSDRELEVFDLIGRGRSSREIAATLHLSLKTIETYRSRIKVKLNLDTASELIHCARQTLQRIPTSGFRGQRTM